MSVMTESNRPLGPPKLGVNGLDICNRVGPSWQQQQQSFGQPAWSGEEDHCLLKGSMWGDIKFELGLEG